MENNDYKSISIVDLDVAIGENGGESLLNEFYYMLESGMNCLNYLDVIYDSTIRITEDNFWKLKRFIYNDNLTESEISIIIANMIASFFLDLCSKYLDDYYENEIDNQNTLYDMIYDNYSSKEIVLKLKQTSNYELVNKK